MDRRQLKQLVREYQKETRLAKSGEPPTPEERLLPRPAVKTAREQNMEVYRRRIRSAPPILNDNLPRQVSDLDLLGAIGGTYAMFFAMLWFGFLGGLMVFGFVADQTAVVLVALGFAVFGLAPLWQGFAEGVRSVRLLRKGFLTWAWVHDVKPRVIVVRSRSDGEDREEQITTYDLTFMYTSPSGQLLMADLNVRSSSPVTDEELELLLCDPDMPSRVTFADLLPGGLRINSHGQVSAAPSQTLLGLLTLAVALIAAAVCACVPVMMLLT
ncbi:MAG: hypothetical protein IPK87_05115 [Planctomycetes bacterium]|nr:hypothetical protein [Planctomycetota bacterium]